MIIVAMETVQTVEVYTLAGRCVLALAPEEVPHIVRGIKRMLEQAGEAGEREKSYFMIPRCFIQTRS